MGRENFVLGTGSPALGPGYRGQRAHALRTRVQRGDVSAEVPRGGHHRHRGGRPSSCASPGASAPELAPVEPGEEPVPWWLCRSPALGMLPPCVKSPLQVCGLSVSQTEFEDGALLSLHLPAWGAPSSPLSGQPGASRLAYLCPCSLNVSQCRWRLLNLVREGRAVSRLCHGFWSAVWSFLGVEGD